MKYYNFLKVLVVMGISMNVAHANGYLSATGGTKEFYVSLEKGDISNNVGSQTKSFPWDLGAHYAATARCDRMNIPKSPNYYKGVAGKNFSPSEYGNSFLKFNDFLDVQVSIFIGGHLQKYVYIPFNNISNLLDNDACKKGQVQTQSEVSSGSKGKITFRVRKKIINGIQINNHEVVELFGRIGNTVSDYGPVPMARVVIKSAILYVPEKCIINEGQTIEVAFGEMGGRDLDGNKNEKVVPIRVRCEGGSFEGAHLNIAMSVSANSAAFGGGDYIKTDKKDLGIKIKQLDGSELKPNSFHPIKMHENIGEWGFIAAPISNNGQEISEGDFNATATIVSEIE